MSEEALQCNRLTPRKVTPHWFILWGACYIWGVHQERLERSGKWCVHIWWKNF